MRDKRQQQIVMLRATLAILESEGGGFVCFALARAVPSFRGHAYDELVSHIKAAIWDSGTYAQWLANQPRASFLGFFLGYGFNDGRCQWVKDMIAELEAGKTLSPRPSMPRHLTFRNLFAKMFGLSRKEKVQ